MNDIDDLIDTHELLCEMEYENEAGFGGGGADGNAGENGCSENASWERLGYGTADGLGEG